MTSRYTRGARTVVFGQDVSMPSPDFAPWLARWDLTADGEAFSSPNAWLLPVTRGGVRAILKISYAPEEMAGARTMQWWDGQGAARVLALDGEALLLERLTGSRDLTAMARAAPKTTLRLQRSAMSWRASTFRAPHRCPTRLFHWRTGSANSARPLPFRRPLRPRCEGGRRTLRHTRAARRPPWRHASRQCSG